MAGLVARETPYIERYKVGKVYKDFVVDHRTGQEHLSTIGTIIKIVSHLRKDTGFGTLYIQPTGTVPHTKKQISVFTFAPTMAYKPDVDDDEQMDQLKR
jgi:hypothetical protein